MKRVYVYLAVLATLFLVACGGDEPAPAPAANQPALPGDPAAGEDLFQQTVLGNQAGCSTCHSLQPDNVIVGPSLAGIAGRAGTTVPGMSAEEYLRTSILDPDDHLVDGFPAGTMPQVWGDVLSEEQLDDIVSFLLTVN